MVQVLGSKPGEPPGLSVPPARCHTSDMEAGGEAGGVRRENNRSFTFGTLQDPCKCVFLCQVLICVLSL